MTEPPSQVLLVEDDPQMQDVLVTLLLEDRIQLECARNAPAALEMVTRKRYDLIVLDLGLPGALDGFEVLRQIKSEPTTESIPVIILTAWNRTEDKLRGFELGAVDYLTKPFEAAELRARLRSALRTYRLAEELTQTNRELVTARLAAEQNARNKAEFLATMSHEIRTPMNGVIAMSSLMLETPLNHEQRGYVETIHSCCESLLTIINEILDFSKIESGRLELELEPFDLRTCVEEALDVLAVKASEKKLDLNYLMDEGIPAQLLGDSIRLKQVLVNLISNSIKFTHAGEVFVHVETHSTPRSGKPTSAGVWQVHISVRDTGIGIPPDQMARLFTPFTQANASTSRKFGGTGLGLAISKRLIDMMNGKLWAESQPDKGSTFHLVLPFAVAPATAAVPLDKSLKSLKGKRLLIVDDNQTNCRVLSAQAGSWDMLPQDTQDPAEALQWLKEGRPFDLAIVDMRMPGMDGIALAREIRKLPGAGKLPLLLLASIGIQTKNPELADADFAACLTKPVKPAQLRELLIQVCSDKQVKPATMSATPTGKLDPGLASRLPLQVLLCDDNQINLKVAYRILQQLGYKADMAVNGREAVTAIERQPYDLVFMDVQMPEMDGLEATRIIRERQKAGQPHFKTPMYIIAITASVMQGDKDKCLQAGMDDYLPKPVRPEDIRRVIERWGAAIGQAALPAQTVVEKKSPSHPAQPTPDAPSPGESPVDMERLLDFSDNDPVMLRDLVTLYIKQTSGQLEQLQAAIAAGKAPDVQRLAHSCAGASATCGMVHIVPALRELERQGYEKNLANPQEWLDKANAEFARIKQFLQPHLAVTPTPIPVKA